MPRSKLKLPPRLPTPSRPRGADAGRRLYDRYVGNIGLTGPRPHAAFRIPKSLPMFSFRSWVSSCIVSHGRRAGRRASSPFLGKFSADPRSILRILSLLLSNLNRWGCAMRALKRYRISPDEIINSEKTPVSTNWKRRQTRGEFSRVVLVKVGNLLPTFLTTKENSLRATRRCAYNIWFSCLQRW